MCSSAAGPGEGLKVAKSTLGRPLGGIMPILLVPSCKTMLAQEQSFAGFLGLGGNLQTKDNIPNLAIRFKTAHLTECALLMGLSTSPELLSPIFFWLASKNETLI